MTTEIELVDPVDTLAAELEPTITVTLTQVSALARSEVEAQLAAAHQYPRSITRFLKEAARLATINVAVAESCIYTLPRAGKSITGPSVRLAEIVSSCYGNLQVAARIVDVTDTEVIAQGMAWDCEKNLRAVIETRRRITKRNGQRFDDDMITMTGNAAASVALRNAIFRVVPRAYVDSIFEKVRTVATGNAKTASTRRGEVLSKLAKMGATQDRVLARLELRGVDDITQEHLETLIGLGTACRDGGCTVDDAFPPGGAIAAQITEAPTGRRVSLRKPAETPPPVSAVLDTVAVGIERDADPNEDGR